MIYHKRHFGQRYRQCGDDRDRMTRRKTHRWRCREIPMDRVNKKRKQRKRGRGRLVERGRDRGERVRNRSEAE